VRPDQIKTAAVIFHPTECKGRGDFDRIGCQSRNWRAALSTGGDRQAEQRDQKEISHGELFYHARARVELTPQKACGYTFGMVSDNIFISRKGYQKMLLEVEELRKRKPLLAAEIKEAMEKGDLKENAEYHAAKEELTHVQRRIAELENRMGSARLLEDQANIPADKVYIGATVVVKDEKGHESTYTLVDAAEANPREGLISVTSPLGLSLMGHPINTTVKVVLGKEGYKLTIVKITRE
jgi:transcription elongation factor GreA